MKKEEKPPIARAITDFVSNAPIICEGAEQVVFDGGSILHLIMQKKNIRCQDAGLKYTSYVISNFRSVSVVCDGYPETLKHNWWLQEMPLDMLFQRKQNAFLRNTANKHRVTHVTLTELMKPGCNSFHLYDNAAIGTTKLSVQSSLKWN